MLHVKEFVSSYLDSLVSLVKTIDPKILEDIIYALESTIKNNSRIYIIGNGGSAATASHMANDLGASGLKRRKIRNFDVISLSDNTPVITAIANDMGYENIFYMQMEGVIQPDDLIIAFSCSGNSANIIKAVTYAKDIGCTVVGATGFDGGELYNLADIKFHIETPTGNFGLVEDIHMIMDHVIYSYYINEHKND